MQVLGERLARPPGGVQSQQRLTELFLAIDAALDMLHMLVCTREHCQSKEHKEQVQQDRKSVV